MCSKTNYIQVVMTSTNASVRTAFDELHMSVATSAASKVM